MEATGTGAAPRQQIVNYADDFVILDAGAGPTKPCRAADMMAKLKLTVNEKKTRTCSMPAEHFDFLGYTFGRLYSRRRVSSAGTPARRSASGAW